MHSTCKISTVDTAAEKLVAWDLLQRSGYDPESYMLMYKQENSYAFKHIDTKQYVFIGIQQLSQLSQ